MKRDRHSASVRMLVALMAARLAAKEKTVVYECSNYLARSDRPGGVVFNGHLT